MAIGMVLQQHLGLRPGEMLNLRTHDLLLPEDQSGSRGVALVSLGTSTGTWPHALTGLELVDLGVQGLHGLCNRRRRRRRRLGKVTAALSTKT